MIAVLKKPIQFLGHLFIKGVHNEESPHTKKLFEKSWFLEALKETGDLVLHNDDAEVTVSAMDSTKPEVTEEKPLKPPKGKLLKAAEEVVDMVSDKDVSSKDTAIKDEK